MNAPAGYTLITDQQWAHGLPPSTTDWRQRDAQGWYTAAGALNGSVQNGILTIRFPTSMRGGSAPIVMNRHLSLNGAKDGTRWHRGLYTCQQVRVRHGFSNSGNVGTKWFQLKNSTVNRPGPQYTLPGFSGGYINLFGGIADQGYMGFNLAGDNSQTDPATGLTVNFNRNMPVKFSWGPATFDGWHEIEVLAVPNTLNQADGTFSFWVDGQLDTQHNDVRWFGIGIDPAVEGWNLVTIDPIYGGGSNSPLQTMYVDVGRIMVRAH